MPEKQSTISKLGVATSINPTLGGRTSTKFKIILTKDFEQKCQYYLKNYPAILTQGKSVCLESNKNLAKYFISDDKITFFLNKTNLKQQ